MGQYVMPRMRRSIGIALASCFGITLAVAAALAQQAAGGRVTGTVRYAGSERPRAATPVPRGLPACGTSAPDPDLTLGAGGALADALVEVVLTRAPAARPARGAARTVTLDQRGCRFVPHALSLTAGDELVVKNSDGVFHNVHMLRGTTSVFNLAQPIRGMMSKRTLSEPGDYQVRCDAGHPWMSARVFVLAHRWHAVTDAQGRFTIDGVPPGRHTLHVVHPRAGETRVPVRVSAHGGRADVTLR